MYGVLSLLIASRQRSLFSQHRFPSYFKLFSIYLSLSLYSHSDTFFSFVKSSQIHKSQEAHLFFDLGLWGKIPHSRNRNRNIISSSCFFWVMDNLFVLTKSWICSSMTKEHVVSSLGYETPYVVPIAVDWIRFEMIRACEKSDRWCYNFGFFFELRIRLECVRFWIKLVFFFRSKLFVRMFMFAKCVFSISRVSYDWNKGVLFSCIWSWSFFSAKFLY